jgi:hypothetical protein
MTISGIAKRIHNFSLAEFQKSYSNMVATSLGQLRNLLDGYSHGNIEKLKDYSIADI